MKVIPLSTPGLVLQNNVLSLRGAEERVTYAVGDVHGSFRELQELLGLIRADMATYPTGTQFRILFIGDLIDRGPDSRRVIDQVMALQEEAARSNGLLCVVSLRGNHEEAALDILDGRPAHAWLWYPDKHGYGGGETFIQSYGAPKIDIPGLDDRENQAGPRAVVRSLILDWVSPQHLAFMRCMPVGLDTGVYLFAHAGARPGVTVKNQEPRDLVHIRKGFLEYEDYDPILNRIVVHGHTPHRLPQVRPPASLIGPEAVRPSRICVDTGCGYGLALTCAVLEPFWDPARLRFLSVANEVPCVFVEGFSRT